MKKVLQSVAIMNRGGQETLWMNVFRKIDRDKLSFDFLVSLKEKGDYDEEIESLGGKVIYAGDNPHSGKFSRYWGEYKLNKAFFKSHPEYDTYHINTCHAFDAFIRVLSARRGGAKRIIVHSHNTSAPHVGLHKIFKPLLRLLKFEAMACSDDAGRWMFGKKWVKKDKVKIVRNGIDATTYLFDEELRRKKRAELNIDESTKLIGHIGRFNYQKNHTFLIDVFESVCKKEPNTRLVLVGRGELEDEIKRKVESKNLSDKVLFLGIRSDVNELLMAMDVFLFPSLFEGLSVVMIEAQATNINIVCSSSLTKDTYLNDNIVDISLEESSDKWAETVIENFTTNRAFSIENIQKAGYDISSTARDIERFYLQDE